MIARIVNMRLNRSPGASGPTEPETATLDLEPVRIEGGPMVVVGLTQVVVENWNDYQLGQVCDLVPQPVAEA